ncbi:S24 family peptidase [Aquirufa aurantiipilula]
MNDSERILQLVDYLRHSKNAIGKSLGDSNGSRLHYVVTGRNKISPKLARDIVTVYPQISYTWLLKGEGEMVNTDTENLHLKEPEGAYFKAKTSSKLKQEVKQVDSSKFMEVPYVSAIAQAGFMNGHFYNHLEELDTMLLPQEFEKGNYIVVEIVGESMNDGTDKSINDGDKLLLKEVEMPLNGHGLNFRQNIFVIVSHEGIVCKQITKHDVEKGIITLHSWNSSYEDYQLNLSSVQKLFYVKKIVERRVKF